MASSKFVDAVIKDPANPPNVKLLVGYIGKSSTDGYIRIYFNAELSEHIDVPESAVLHIQDVPDDHLDAKYVWINKDVEVTVRDAGRAELKSRFMSGPLAESASDTAVETGGKKATFASPSVVQICPTPSFNPATCPTETLRCPSALGACPSIDLACPTLIPQACPINTSVKCPTVMWNCPTGICPSQLFECPQPTDAGCPPRTLADCPRPSLIGCPPFTQPNLCQIFTRQQNCFPTRNGCQTLLGGCGSAVDACPSAFCGTAFGTIFRPFM